MSHILTKKHDLETAKANIQDALRNIEEHETNASALFQLEFAREKLATASDKLRKWT